MCVTRCDFCRRKSREKPSIFFEGKIEDEIVYPIKVLKTLFNFLTIPSCRKSSMAVVTPRSSPVQNTYSAISRGEYWTPEYEE